MTNEELMNRIDEQFSGLDRFILGLKQEVLEIKEVLNDDYYKKNVTNQLFLGKNALNSYLNEEQIGQMYETKSDSIEKYNILIDRINQCASNDGLLNYTRLGDFQNKVNEIKNLYDGELEIINDKLGSLQSVVNTFTNNDEDDNSGLFYTKEEINNLFATKDEIPSTFGFAKTKYVAETYLRKKDLAANLENLTYTKEEIDNKFVSEEEMLRMFGATDDNISNLVSASSFNDFKSEMKSNISNFVTKNWLIDRFEKNFVTTSLLDDYLTTFEFSSKMDELDGRIGLLATKNDLDSYAKNSDIASMMGSFVTKFELDEKVIEKLDLYQHDLSGYVMSSDFNSEISTAKRRLSAIENMMASVVTDNNFNEHTSNLVKKNDLFNYVKKSELNDYIASLNGGSATTPNITNFLTYDDASSLFVSKSEINRYIPDITGYASMESIDVINERINGLNSTIMENMSKITEISDSLDIDYYTKNEIDEKFSDLVPTDEQLRQYIKKSEVRQYIGFDAYKFASKVDLYNVYLKLNDYVKYTDAALMRDYVNTADYQTDKNEMYSYINDQVTSATKGGKLVTIDDVESLLDDKLTKYMTERKLEEKIVKLCTPTRIRKMVEECVTEDFVNETKSYIDNQMNAYLKPEDKDEFYAYVDNKVVDERIDADVLNARLDTFVTTDEMRRQMSEYFSEVNYKNVIEETITDKTVHIIDSLLSSKMQNNYLTPNDKDAIYNYVNNKIGGIDYVKEESLREVLSNYVTERDMRRKIEESFSDSNINRIINNLLTQKLNNIIEDYIDTKMGAYLTESQANTKYLQLEDYKNLKYCAIMSDHYKDNPEEFFAKVIGDNGEELDRTRTANPLRNGFYIVERNVYLVFEGTVIELDKLEYNWKIEE